MNYIFFKNITLFKKNLFIYFFIQLVLFITLFFINSNIISYFEIKDYLAILGLIKIQEIDSINCILKIFSFLVLIYTTYRVYLFDVVNNAEYLLLRESKKYLLFQNLFIIFTLILIMRLILYVILLAFCKIYNGIFNFSLLLLIKDLLYHFLLSSIAILIINFFSINKITRLVSYLFMAFLVLLSFFNVIDINIIILIIGIISVLLLNFLLFNPTFLYNYYKS